jgi:hypothetical protein
MQDLDQIVEGEHDTLTRLITFLGDHKREMISLGVLASSAVLVAYKMVDPDNLPIGDKVAHFIISTGVTYSLASITYSIISPKLESYILDRPYKHLYRAAAFVGCLALSFLSGKYISEVWEKLQLQGIIPRPSSSNGAQEEAVLLDTSKDVFMNTCGRYLGMTIAVVDRYLSLRHQS